MTPMLDEGTLRERFPEIPWDQPVPITITADVEMHSSSGGRLGSKIREDFTFFACRYCIALKGIKSEDVLAGRETNVFRDRDEALTHIDQVHHD